MNYPGGFILIHYLWKLKAVRFLSFLFLVIFSVGLFVLCVIAEFTPSNPKTPLNQAWAEEELIYNKKIPFHVKALDYLCYHLPTTVIIIYFIPPMIYLVYNRMTKSRRQQEGAMLLEERAKRLEAMEIAARVRRNMATSEATRNSPGN